jgi:hypothetical protein
MRNDAVDKKLRCKFCTAPGKPWEISIQRPAECGCEDYDCGTQRLCETGDLALSEGLYQSKACKQLAESGGWKHE